MRALSLIAACAAFAAPAFAQTPPTTLTPPVGGQPSLTQPGGPGGMPNNAGGSINATPNQPAATPNSSVTSPTGAANPGANIGSAQPSGPGSNAGSK